MHNSASPPPRCSLSALGRAALSRVVESGLLRCAVPPDLGGSGGSLAELADGAQALATQDSAAAWVLWAQRLAIGALICSRNIGLRDYVLPDLLSGERAGTMPVPQQPQALVAMDAGRGQRLYGRLQRVPNLQPHGYSLVAPVQLDHGAPQWVLLRSEEDGLRAGLDLGAPCPPGSRTATLVLDGVFFRADEWLANGDLPDLLRPTADALSACLAQP